MNKSSREARKLMSTQKIPKRSDNKMPLIKTQTIRDRDSAPCREAWTHYQIGCA